MQLNCNCELYFRKSDQLLPAGFQGRMATESPMLLVGSSGASKWPSSKEAMAFKSSSNNVAPQDLGLLLRRHRISGNGRDVVPNRTGSAPPSIEGSFAAIRNLISQQNSNLEGSVASLNSATENCESEEQLRADPAYLAYYWANINLNPRLPPPLISREKQRLVHHIGGFGDNRKLTSFDDNSSGSFYLPRAALSTHREEPEDERSPRQASEDWAERNAEFLSGHFTTSLAGRHKSLVDLIQEDFPRTPSPVYNQLCSSSHAAEEEIGDPDDFVNPLNDSSTSTTRVQESNMTSIGVLASTSTLGDMTGSSLLGLKGESNSLDVHVDVDINAIQSEMKVFSISDLPDAEGHGSQPEWKHPQPHNFPRHQLHSQRSTACQLQGVLSQMTSQGMHHFYDGMDHISHGQSKHPTVEVWPVLQTSGISTPLYATTTATSYMASGSPFYPNLEPSSLFTPQYSIGGYALNATLLPPFVAGYPPPSAIPMAFNNSAGPSFSSRSANQLVGESVAPGVDLQHPYKFYGQFGLAPPFVNPFHMHYFQHPSEDAYSAAGQYDSLAPRIDIVESHDAFDLQKGPPLAAIAAGQTSQFPRSGALSIPSMRKAGMASSNSYESPPGMGVLMQYPASPLLSPVLPGSPMATVRLPGRTTDNFRFPMGLNRSIGEYSGWQRQKGIEKFDDPKSYSFPEDLKSSKAHKFELSDIAGRIVEFSADQHGSRFIQQKLENCSAEEKASVLEEVLPHASMLMTDVFGNYVIQKFLEHGSHNHRRELADQLAGRILPLSLQMYGCRVIQKALEVIEINQKINLVLELDGHVMQCVHDQNGNHVIQKCIECMPTEKIGFIISAFHGQVATLSTHPYGCRVIQRILEHCTDEKQTQYIVDEILQSASSLAQDQYGNYVTQHVLEKGKPHERSQIITKLAGHVVHMSQHKFASNVIEKCLEHGDSTERELLIEEIVGQTEGNDNLLTMMKDQFANYVVQKILETCTDKQREILLNRIRVHLHALKKYTYGKHIVARAEQLFVAHPS
ncbi:pumilio homolog 5-like isoform X3 [Magnolia sinica]|uniref:pumilio homolog 5-like isoform X3 n=1 Tax=Magnolia sinica TaxID=86752 RepID=UPI0026592794|nr:pumilio homolog 5-like isoform X3 [Magnolia sinica]